MSAQDKVQEALKFYASERTYYSMSVHEEGPAIEDDQGAKAREALAALSGEAAAVPADPSKMPLAVALRLLAEQIKARNGLRDNSARHHVTLLEAADIIAASEPNHQQEATAIPEGFTITQAGDEITVECDGMARATVNVMSLDAVEMLLAALGEALLKRQPATRAEALSELTRDGERLGMYEAPKVTDAAIDSAINAWFEDRNRTPLSESKLAPEWRLRMRAALEAALSEKPQ